MNSRDVINTGRMKDSSSAWRLWDLTAPDLTETFRRSYPTKPKT